MNQFVRILQRHLDDVLSLDSTQVVTPRDNSRAPVLLAQVCQIGERFDERTMVQTVRRAGKFGVPPGVKSVALPLHFFRRISNDMGIGLQQPHVRANDFLGKPDQVGIGQVFEETSGNVREIVDTKIIRVDFAVRVGDDPVWIFSGFAIEAFNLIDFVEQRSDPLFRQRFFDDNVTVNLKMQTLGRRQCRERFSKVLHNRYSWLKL